MLKKLGKDTSAFALSESKPAKKNGSVTINIPEGDWLLRVSYGEAYVGDRFPFKLSWLGGFFSFIVALLAYRKAQEPYKLNKIIEEKSKQLLNSERYFRTLIETSSDAVVLLGIDGKVLYQTPSAENILGYSLAEIQEIDGIELIHPDDREQDNKMFETITSNPGIVVQSTHRIKHKTGNYIAIEGTYRNLLHDENVSAIVYNYKDITERKRMETELREAELKFRTVAEKSMLGVYITQNKRFLYVNPRFAEIFGYTSQELMDLSTGIIDTIYAEESRAIIREKIRARDAGETEGAHYEAIGLKKDGTRINVEFYGNRVTIHGQPATIGTTLDISERKRTEVKLIEAELKFRTLVEQSIVGVYIVQNEKFIYVNPRLAEIFGYSSQELLNLPDGPIMALFTEESRKLIRANLQARYSGETESVRYEVVGIRKDGTSNNLEIYGSIVTIDGEISVIGTILDITERKRAEEQVLKEKELSETVINSLPGVFYLRDEQGRALRWNKNLEEVMGYTAEEIKGVLLRNFVAVEDLGFLRETAEKTFKEGYATVEVRLVPRSGHRIPYLLTQRPVYYEGQLCVLGTGIDISQRVKAEEELKVSEQNLARYNRELNLLNKINDIIIRIHDEFDLYKEVCDCIVKSGGYKLAWVCYKPDADGAQTLIPLAAAGVSDYLNEIKISLDDPELSKGPTARALIKGETFVNNDVTQTTTFGPWLETAKRYGIYSSLVLKLDMGNSKAGALTIYSGHPNAFDQHEVYMLERLAANLSIAVQAIKNRSILIESENRFRRAFDDSAIGMGLTSIEADSMGRWLKVNRSLCEMLGYTESELLSYTFMQITHPDDLARDLTEHDRILQGESDTYRHEKRYIHKNGSSVWINLNVSMVRDKDKHPIYLLVQVENITGRIESQIKFQNLVENFIVGVYIHQHGKIAYVNPRALEETGYTEEDLIGQTFEQFIYKEDLNLVKRITEARQKGHIDTVRYEARFVRKDGQHIWFEIFGSRTIYQGAPALMGTMVNIADRKNAEEEVLRLTRLYRFISRINESILKSENAIEVYREACRIAIEVGGFRMAWIGIYNEQKDSITPIVWNGHEGGFLKAIDVESMKVSESAIPSARAIRDGSHFYYNDIANDPDIPQSIKNEMVKMGYLSGVSLPIFIGGNIVAAMVLLMDRPFFFNEDEIKLLRGMIDNITYALDKIRILELQNQSEANLRSIFDSTDVSYLLLDTKYKIISLNEQMRAIYRDNMGITLREGDNLIDLISPDRRETRRKLYDTVQLTKKAAGYEASFNNEGVERHFAASVFPIIVGDDVIGICISTIDITERKNALEKLKEVNENLKKHAKELAISNAELEQFAYVASHDLQEPLRMVTSFMTQLEKKYGDVVDDKGKQYIHFAVDGAKRMRQIILDLLDFSRAGQTEDNLEDVNFNTLINEILVLYRRQIEEQHAQITIENLPTFQTYKTPLREVFQNLISNGLKYHKANKAPVIHISFLETETHYQFSVKDNGIGIAPEYFDKIFIIFQRLHNKDEYWGTGMGLAITKKIVENLGGKIWVDSSKENGSTFYFTLLKSTKS
ncbi:MAG: PAS domain S-box protein [Mucilaginibacter sp.]